jgi:hypothetical protein
VTGRQTCGQTAADTLRWYKAQDESGRTKLAGPAPAKEAELLAAWKGERGPQNG